MAKYSLKLTKRYLRDLKLARKRGMDENLLNEIIGKLLDGESLPEKNQGHRGTDPVCHFIGRQVTVLSRSEPRSGSALNHGARRYSHSVWPLPFCGEPLPPC